MPSGDPVAFDLLIFTADQIARHESGHDMVAKGEVDIKSVRKRLIEIAGGKENIDDISKLYAEAYEGTTLDGDEIFEELICDSLGDMNIFAYGEEAAELMALAIPDVQRAVNETKGEPNQTRGSPESEGKASRTLRQKYFAYQDLPYSVVSHIEKELRKLYSDVEEGIADDIAVEYDNEVYITDSSMESGDFHFGIHRETIYEIDDAETRKQFIRMWNDDSISKERISDGLLGKLGYKQTNSGTSNRQLSLGNELQTDSGKSEYNEEGVSQENWYQGVSRERTGQKSNDEINSLLKELRATLNSEVESHVADENDPRDKEIYDQLKELVDKNTQGKTSRELDSALTRLTDIKTELNQVRDSIKQIESSEDYKSMMSKLTDAISNDDVANGIQAYEAWKKQTGYGELMQRRDELVSQ